MTLAIVLAAGQSTRLPAKQLLVPPGCADSLIVQAVNFGRRCADRVVVVATSELADKLPALGCRVIDVGRSPATPIDSALAARWHAAEDEQVIVLDSDAVYARAELELFPEHDFVGVAFAPYATAELSAVAAVSKNIALLSQKEHRACGELVGAGVYGFATFRSFRERRSAGAPERSMAGLFAYRPAAKFYIHQWWPYGTEHQRTSYDAHALHESATRDIHGA